MFSPVRSVALCVLALVLAAASGAALADPSTYEPGDPRLGFNLPNWQHGGPGTLAWEAAVKGIYDLGVREVSIITYRFVDKTTGGISATSAFGLASPADNAQIAAAIAKGESLGMNVTLNPFLYVDNNSGIGHDWRGNLDFSGPALTTFFANYQSYMVEIAQLGQTNGAERVLIGSELQSLTANAAAASHWGDVISAVRGAFSGPLSYAANHGEYPGVPFWGQLDEIGVDAYFSLATQAEATGVGNPSVATIVSNWELHLAALQAFGQARGKPVVLHEWGTVPYDLTTCETWNWKPTDIDDPQEQLNACIATVEASDLDGDWLGGINFWHWSMPGNDSSTYHIRADSLPGQYIGGYVPEPTTLALLAVGTCLPLLRKRKKTGPGQGIRGQGKS